MSADEDKSTGASMACSLPADQKDSATGYILHHLLVELAEETPEGDARILRYVLEDVAADLHAEYPPPSREPADAEAARLEAGGGGSETAEEYGEEYEEGYREEPPSEWVFARSGDGYDIAGFGEHGHFNPDYSRVGWSRGETIA